jgi:predicted O-methyltransferase YrrM
MDKMNQQPNSKPCSVQEGTPVGPSTQPSLGRLKQHLRRRILLACPRLYATNRVKYERSLTREGEIEALLTKLDATLAIPGDIIECGCYLCGSTVSMARLLQKRGSVKRIYACDSFAGFDPSELSSEKKRTNVCHPSGEVKYATNDFAYVQQKLKRLGVADEVVLIKGLFQDTLESLQGPYSFAFIDCDLHDSTLYATRTVWPRLSPGGCCVFDDYVNDEYRGAARAIAMFIAEQAHSIGQHGPLSVKMYFAFKA